jgi:methylmalonyl-CoA/ethylmalonyl-CoA epimerase
MMNEKPTLDHIGIAVESLADGRRFYEALGLEVGGEEVVAEQEVQVAFLDVGDSRLELLEPTSASSPIAKHLEKRGAGLHHICLRVADIRRAMNDLRTAGYVLLSEEPQQGAHGCQVCFVHPRSAGGVLVELSQPGAETTSSDSHE